MFNGVNHVGITVSDMKRSMKFYDDLLGFKEVIFDYTGLLPGMELVSGKPETKARIVMLSNKNKGPIGLGNIKLINLLPPDMARPIPKTETWGETGIAEIALNTRNSASIFGELVLKGAKPLLTPAIPEVFPPYDNNVVAFSYVADPDGTKIELNALCTAWPGLGTEPRVEGINHVAFGVSNMDKALKFYRRLGFTELVVDSTGFVSGMATWYPKPTKLHIVILANYHGAWIEAIEHQPASRQINNNWGRLGPMEFAIGVSNIEKAYVKLQEEGIKFLSPPQKLDVTSGEWKYVYLDAPDKLCVSLVEARY